MSRRYLRRRELAARQERRGSSDPAVRVVARRATGRAVAVVVEIAEVSDELGPGQLADIDHGVKESADVECEREGQEGRRHSRCQNCHSAASHALTLGPESQLRN